MELEEMKNQHETVIFVHTGFNNGSGTVLFADFRYSLYTVIEHFEP